VNLFGRLQFWLNWLQTDPLQFLIYFVYLITTVLLSLMLHEIAHGYVAWRCGDPTAKMLGRLTLNPLKHLDPIGTACMFLLGFGWAKPVPVNPRNFSNFRRDDFLVSVAGIATNLSLFIISSALAVGINGLLWMPEVIQNYGAKELLTSNGLGYNILILGQGSANVAAMKTPWLQYVQRFLLMFSSINLGLGIFNLLPIPPLDGFHIVNDLLLRGKLYMNRQFFQGAQIVLMVLVFSGILSGLMSTVMGTIESGVLNVFLRLSGLA
jgi:Zn-dependent protease